MEKPRRQVAYKVRIKDIINGQYVKEGGEFTPNYVLVNDKQVSRADIMGVVIDLDQENKSIVINDGSDSISLRIFEEKEYKVSIGDIILVIGRPREFNNEKYIVPEIIKKIENKKWVELRKAELKLIDLLSKGNAEQLIETEEIVLGANNNYNDIFRSIKEIDNGDGADIQEVISRSKVIEAEAIIKNLLKEGEIFEIRPGRVKVLE